LVDGVRERSEKGEEGFVGPTEDGEAEEEENGSGDL
jgi:hypothetical protein